MNRTFGLLLGGLAMAMGLAAAVPVAAAAGWLDTPLVRWNGPHQGVPQPPVQTNTRTGQPLDITAAVPASCLRQERGPASEEEKQVVSAGWRLQSYWPSVQQADITVVTALSWYDGMCRPWAYQAFAFAGGRFAGTLSPVVMNSRFDGTLFEGPLVHGGAIEATFTRYADTDPLCCPSLPRVWVRYELVAEAGQRYFTPTSTRSLPLSVETPAVPVQPSVPSRLPNTGDIAGDAAALGLVLGLLSVAGAVGDRRRVGREAVGVRRRDDDPSMPVRRRYE